MPRNPFGVFSIEDYIIDDYNPNGYKIFGRFNGNRQIKFLNQGYTITKNQEYIDVYKVFVSKADGAAGQIGNPIPAKIIGKAELGTPRMICTETFLAIAPFDNENEAKNVVAYMATKFFRFCVGIRKNKNMTRDTYGDTPLQDFSENSDIDWSVSIPEIDKQFYAKYNLSPDEISFIETMIKPME